VIRLTVLVPAYNEQDTIVGLLRKVRAQQIPDVEMEVIVVDDGSKDRTVELLRSNPDLYDELVEMPRNGGKGAAVRAGLARATGDYVLFQDADLEYDPADYAALLAPALRFDADVVIGSRMIGAPWTRVYYFWHKQGNQLLTLAFNLLFNTTFTDIYTCYLLYRRSLLDVGELEADGWEQHAEILCRVVARARVCYEVPITYAGRTYDEGKKIRAHHAIAVMGMILKRRLARGSDRARHQKAALPRSAESKQARAAKSGEHAAVNGALGDTDERAETSNG
jgi:glycosyltransferase involved in cell wall biosynthesis